MFACVSLFVFHNLPPKITSKLKFAQSGESASWILQLGVEGPRTHAVNQGLGCRTDMAKKGKKNSSQNGEAYDSTPVADKDDSTTIPFVSDAAPGGVFRLRLRTSGKIQGSEKTCKTHPIKNLIFVFEVLN